MNILLTLLLSFIIVARSRYLIGESVDGAFRDNYPAELKMIVDHCSQDYFYRELTIINGNDRQPVPEFYRNVNEDFRIPVALSDDINKLNSVSRQSCVVLCLSIRKIRHFLRAANQYSWTPTNVYVIHAAMETAEEYEHLPREYIRSVSYELWREKFVHKLVFSLNGSNLFFDPFEPSTSSSIDESHYPDPPRTARNSHGVLRDLGHSAEPLKTRDNFSGFEANVVFFPYVTVEVVNGTYRGLDANAMSEICERMNIAPRLYDPPETFGWLANGTFTGTLGRMVYHQSDLSFNGFFIKDYGSEKLEFSTYLASDDICAIVPKRGRLPEYLLIARIFSYESWTLICLGDVFVAFVYTAMTSFVSKSIKFLTNNKSSPFARVPSFLGDWIFFCLYPMKEDAKWISLRLHLAFGLTLGVVVSGCFTSQLASSFSRPVFLKNIDTLAELDDSGLDILTVFPNLLKDVFTGNESPTYVNLQKKLRLANNSETDHLVFGARKGGYLDRRQSVTLDKDVKHELHIVPDCPRRYHLAYLIAKGSPFLPRLNTIIGRLHNGGFYDKWFRDMRTPPESQGDRNPVVIRLPHLYIPFLILFCGLLIAAGTFYKEFSA